MKTGKRLHCFVLVLVGCIFGYYLGYKHPQVITHWYQQILKSDDLEQVTWPDNFMQVAIASEYTDTDQAAYFLKAPDGQPQPLVVSLHTWSADYSQWDALAPLVSNEGWNYIHPDFQGPNQTSAACLSDTSIKDIDNAIQYAIDKGNVDLNNIFVVGSSGGGFATLGTYLKSRHSIRAFLAWAPISDLSTWFYQSLQHNPKYSADILACTGSLDRSLDITKARQRSPLYWTLPEKLPERLEIYAGLDDGHNGAVPISQSITFYNRIANYLGYHGEIVTEQDTIRLLTRAVDPGVFTDHLGNRGVYYKQDVLPISLTVFDGGHEILPDYSVDRIRTLISE